MRKRFVLTRIIPILGLMLVSNALVWGQDVPVPESLSLNERTMTIAGRVSGETTLQNAEVMAVLLLPGWSEALSAEIAAGKAPLVILGQGRVERIAAGQSVPGSVARTGSFEFRNIAPGEYQAVAVRIKAGADSGAAIAVGNRVVVEDRDIADLDLAIQTASAEPPIKRQGGASAREPVVLETVNKPMNTGPAISPTSFPSSPAYSRKREILEQIIVTAGLVAAMLAFSLW